MIRKILKTFFVIVVVFGFSYLIAILGREWIKWFLNLDKTVAGTIITAFVGLIGLIYSQQQIKRRELLELHRPNKVETYEALFIFLKYTTDNEQMFIGKTYEEIQQLELPEEIKNVIWKLNKGLLIWSSPKVVRAWSEYRQSVPKGKNPLSQLDTLLRAVRKDLGNSNWGLRSGDAMRSFLKRPEEYDNFKALYDNQKNKIRNINK